MANVDEEQYKELFGLGIKGDPDKAKKALYLALDIRKFEIELYWKRATYFWALIAVAFAGYFAIMGAKGLTNQNYYAFIVGCVGFMFTWAWFFVNRGSKFWQENWENHVDMLEDTISGPLYKTVLSRPKKYNLGWTERYFTGPLAMSPSKINQLVSVFTLCIWIVLIANAVTPINTWLLPCFGNVAQQGLLIVGLITFLFCLLIFFRGRTYLKVFEHEADRREAIIIKP